MTKTKKVLISVLSTAAVLLLIMTTFIFAGATEPCGGEHTPGEPIDTWSEDFSECTRVVKCSVCDEVVLNEKGYGVSGYDILATCDTSGYIFYQAYFYSEPRVNTYTAAPPALGHTPVDLE